ncbi:SAM-dependent methyltransferase [Kitasatospora sp. NPDC058046]|uniref:SAM-dependent methyltransferase n=1 Tax=Kitasatospora sp. NPDC058046 TaxID=3346312 RepID=UPI0036DCD922
MSEQPLLRTPRERDAFDYYDNKRDDALNLGLGDLDGYYHHHFAVGTFDASVLSLAGADRERAVNAEMHRMETRQVDYITELLRALPGDGRILDGGSGRGGTALLLHRALGCQVDGVNISAYQNEFARQQAYLHGCADHVHFHNRNMAVTGFPDNSFDAVVTNEATMYIDLHETFAEFARVLKPGGRYVLMTWCNNDAMGSSPAETMAIDTHYHCHTNARSTYLRELLNANLIPYQVDDFTRAAVPYWVLRSLSHLATGIEKPYLDGYLSDRVNYMRIAARLK